MTVGMTYEKFYLKAKIAIENSLKIKEVQEIVARFGYPKGRLEEGKRLYDESFELYQNQIQMFSESTEAGKRCKKAFERADEKFAVMVKLARVALEGDKAALEQLGIKSPRKRTIAGWIVQAELFYNHSLANKSTQDKLSMCGINHSNLIEGQMMLKEVVELYKEKEEKEGYAQVATKKKDLSLERLKEWHRKYVKVAKIALAEVPQLIETLGIIERS